MTDIAASLDVVHNVARGVFSRNDPALDRGAGPDARPHRTDRGERDRRLSALRRSGHGDLDDLVRGRLDGRLLERHALARRALRRGPTISDVGLALDRAAGAARALGDRVPRLPLLLRRRPRLAALRRRRRARRRPGRRARARRVVQPACRGAAPRGRGGGSLRRRRRRGQRRHRAGLGSPAVGAPGDRRRRAARHRAPARRAAHRVLPARGRLGVPVGVLRSRDGAHAAPLHAQGHRRRQHVGTRAGMGHPGLDAHAPLVRRGALPRRRGACRGLVGGARARRPRGLLGLRRSQDPGHVPRHIGHGDRDREPADAGAARIDAGAGARLSRDGGGDRRRARGAPSTAGRDAERRLLQPAHRPRHASRTRLGQLLPVRGAARAGRAVRPREDRVGGRMPRLKLGFIPIEFGLYGGDLEKRGARFEEQLAIMKGLWTQERFAFKGTYYTVDGRIEPKPVTKPHPPVWIGGWGDITLRRAATLADNWIPGPTADLARLVKGKEQFLANRRAAGRTQPIAEWPLTRDLIIAETDKKARELAEEHIMVAYRREYAGGWRHPFIDASIATELDRLMADRFLIAGPDQVIPRIRTFVEAYGMTHLICRTFFPGMPHAHIMRTLELLAGEVMPAFK